MPTTFARTLRSLQADRLRWAGLEVLLLGLVGAGLAWAILGRVTVYETSRQARLEVKIAAHAVAAPVGGRVVENRLTVGHEVKAGDILVVLDAEAERRALALARARRTALGGRQRALQDEIAAEQAAAQVHQKARPHALAEGQAKVSGAKMRARFTSQQVELLSQLRKGGTVSPLELAKGVADNESAAAEVRSLEFGLVRLEHDLLTEESDRRTRLAKLQREAAELEGDLAVEEANASRLDNEIALRTIRAPLSGQVGEAAEYRPGSVVRAADKVGAIVPPGNVHAVGLFPAAAVGRIHRGQAARLRLHGFAWTQYGTLGATVKDIGTEAKDGLIRVELALDPDQASRIPREHGLPGEVEVEIERVAPALLVLRAAGHLLTARATAEPGGEGAGER